MEVKVSGVSSFFVDINLFIKESLAPCVYCGGGLWVRVNNKLIYALKKIRMKTFKLIHNNWIVDFLES